MSEVERMLRGALVPVEPSMALSERLERRLSELTDAAVGELAEFDPSALRDPRRWARLVAAGIVAGTAGGALLLAGGGREHPPPAEQGLRALPQRLRRGSGGTGRPRAASHA